MVNAQKWLEEKYSKKSRKKIKELNIESKELDGDLDLTDFINLEKLDCSKNNLVGLKLNGNIRLEKIDCSFNNLFDLSVNSNVLVYLDYSSNNLLDTKFIIDSIKCPKMLTYLNLRNNCFSPNTLEIFSDFSNLEELYLGTNDLFRISANIYNRFYGSLQPLEELEQLRKLCINNTEINRGWEYLPNNLQELFISDVRERKTGEDLGLIEIITELNSFKDNLMEWKKNKLLEKKQREIFKKIIDSLKEDIKNSESQKDNLKNELENLKRELTEEKNNFKKSQEELEKINGGMKDKLNISKSKEKEVEDLQAEENVNYKEANAVIREVYERLAKENEQLRNRLGLKSREEEIKEMVKKDNESKIEVPIKEVTRKR